VTGGTWQYKFSGKPPVGFIQKPFTLAMLKEAITGK
jgi:hypothetical protein